VFPLRADARALPFAAEGSPPPGRSPAERSGGRPPILLADIARPIPVRRPAVNPESR